VDVVIDFVCTTDTLSKGFNSLNKGGRLVCLASGRVQPSEATLTITPRDLVLTERVLTGSRGATKQELADAIEMVGQGRIKPVITQRFSFSVEEVERAHKMLDEGKIFGRAVLVM